MDLDLGHVDTAANDYAREIADLRLRIQTLEREAERASTRRLVHRRYFPILALAGVTLLAAVTLPQLPIAKGNVLTQIMEFSSPVVTAPPLPNSSIRWQRHDPSGLLPGRPNQILSLVAEATQQNSSTWPLYVQLSATDHPNADRNTSQNVGATVRAFNRSAGTPWLAAYHSEIYHGMTNLPVSGGQRVDARGTSILFNGELINKSGHGETIGLNLQNTPDSDAGATHAINIQSTSPAAIWQNGIHFEGVNASISGNIGINFDLAHYNMGIDLAENSLRLNAGQKIILEKFGAIYLWYNPVTARVELVKSGRVAASW